MDISRRSRRLRRLKMCPRGDEEEEAAVSLSRKENAPLSSQKMKKYLSPSRFSREG